MRTYFYCLIVLLVASCSGYRYIDIQVLNPAALTIPMKDSIMMIVVPDKISADSIKESLRYHLEKLVNREVTSTLVTSLKQSPTFDISFIATQDSDYLDSITKKFDNKNKELLMLRIKYLLFIENYGVEQTLDLSYKFQFSLSNLKTKEVIDWFPITNSFSCSEYYIDENVSGASNEVAETYAHRIVPYWSTEERMMYYSGNRLMREGYNNFCMNNLDSALTVWHRLYEVGTKRLGSMAAYNMALIYEMQDNLDYCEQWLVKSNEAQVRLITIKYLDIIKKRKLERMLLEKQVGNRSLNLGL
jgi:hypothetical protein